MVFNDARGRSGTVVAGTRVQTLEVLTCQLGWTTTVLEANRDGGLASLGAHAKGLVVQHLAGLAVGAEGGVAGALAGLLQAGQLRGTVVVILALFLLGWATQLPHHVDSQLVLARADGLVILSHAFLRFVLALLEGARVLALAILTEVGGQAVFVGGALPARRLHGYGSLAMRSWDAFDVRSAREALRALAPGLVKNDSA